MSTVTIAKVNYWSSEEYGKIMDAMGALQDTVFKMLDEFEKLEPIANAIAWKIGLADSDGFALREIADNDSDLTLDVLDRLHDVYKAIG